MIPQCGAGAWLNGWLTEISADLREAVARLKRVRGDAMCHTNPPLLYLLTLVELQVFAACIPVGCQLSEDVRGTGVRLIEQSQHDRVVGQVCRNTQLDLLEVYAANIWTRTYRRNN